MVIPETSTEYLRVPVTSKTNTDLSDFPVRIAIVGHADNPDDDEWHDATWADDHARLLIGPDSGALALTAGTYRVWVNIDPPGVENIVRQAPGRLRIT